jgi:hypothetical protein
MDNRDPVNPEDRVTPGKLAAEGVGGAAAGTAGAAIGAMAGPVGMLVGGLAGIIGGWWAGKAAVESTWTNDDDTFYRNSYERSTAKLADRSYDDLRPAYQIGHIAGRNPDYRDRDWNDVDRDLQRAWNDDVRARHGDWQTARPFARDAFSRSRSAIGDAGATVGQTAREVGHKAANAIDDLKDRVDANPASRPGPDETDRPDRLR